MLASAVDPTTYSLVRDYFSATSRGTANSIISVAPYIGSGLSSMSVLFIHKFGWRAMYNCIGIFGIILSAISFIFLKEPSREKSE